MPPPIHTLQSSPPTLTIFRPPPPAGLLLPFPDGKRFIPADQILALRSERNYTHIHFRNGRTLLYSRTLGYLLELLPASAFARIHRSHAVNRGHIACAHDTSVALVDGSVWGVSRRFRLMLEKIHS